MEIRRIIAHDQLTEKVSKTQISTNNLCVVANTYDPSFREGIDRRVAI
jgi:hypothetical protein